MSDVVKLATWNVNSLRVRLPQVLAWLAEQNPDVLCLQETKLADVAFPFAELSAAGYHAVASGQKTYNGVAILSRHPISDVCCDIADYDDPQKRIIAATVCDTRIVCAYFPNGQAVDSDKYHYKLGWIQALQRQIDTELAQHARLALLGDYNIAPEDRDVHDPVAWKDQILCSAPERAAFARLLASGLQDAFRLFAQAERRFSWWDYRMMGFRRNLGLRIDHILLSPALAAHCQRCDIDTTPRGWDRPSDHAPVIAVV